MSNPYGQPYPGGYGYQQPGYQQPGYPPPGYQPGYPMYPQSPPSGATAITAGIIALILGLIAGIGGIIAVIAAASLSSDRSSGGYGSSRASNDFEALLIGLGIVVTLIGAFWFIGALLLFARKTAGRVMLILASGLGVVSGLVQFTLGEFTTPIFGLGISLTILVLCAVPATGRWIAAGKHPVYPPGYNQYPYY
ncbi:hypothetical protein [Nocardia sp. NPDC005978]|uniref:hypothetical protein n=1 Tax=unclassified Nocardia TaxID=2637762 RepID=UPI0033B68351